MHNGLRGQKLERSNQCSAENCAGTLAFSLTLGPVILIFCLFAQLFGFPTQDDWGVCLWQKEESHDLNESCCDGRRVKDPSPGRILRNEPACYGADCRAQYGCKTIDGEGLATLLRTKTVCENSTSNLNSLVKASLKQRRSSYIPPVVHFLPVQRGSGTQSSAQSSSRHRMRC